MNVVTSLYDDFAYTFTGPPPSSATLTSISVDVIISDTIGPDGGYQSPPHPGGQTYCAPCKGVGLQWVQFPPGKLVAPASSYRSGGGGNKTVGAFETMRRFWRCSEQAGRNLSERRAGLETTNVDADLALGWGRPQPLASM
jgi:hypothetical protein